MNSSISQLVRILVITLAVGLSACHETCLPVPPLESNEVCIWVGADKDAFVSFGRVGEEANSNFGLHGSLGVASGPLGRKYAFVHFTPPTMPPGTEILEARLELFHGARNGDGTTDDIQLAVARVHEAWSPQTITWNNQPYARSRPTSEIALRLRSQAWSGTPDIAGAVRDMLSSPSANHGFVIWYEDPGGRQVDKGFYANNDYRRRQNDLGLSPRLLIRVKLPAGSNAASMQLGTLAPDHDLTRLGQPILMAQTVTGSQGWPAAWNVAP